MLIRIVGRGLGRVFMSHENLIEAGAHPGQDNKVSEQASRATF